MDPCRRYVLDIFQIRYETCIEIESDRCKAFQSFIEKFCNLDKRTSLLIYSEPGVQQISIRFPAPPPYMSNELQMSGKRARTAGIPALKLWPEMLLASWPMYGYSNFAIIELKFLLVMQVPESKQKLGCLGHYY